MPKPEKREISLQRNPEYDSRTDSRIQSTPLQPHNPVNDQDDQDKYKTLKRRPDIDMSPAPSVSSATAITQLVPKPKKSKTKLRNSSKADARIPPTKPPYRSYSTTDEDPESSDEDMAPGSLLAAQRLPIGVPDKSRIPRLKSHVSAPAVPMARKPSRDTISNLSSANSVQEPVSEETQSPQTTTSTATTSTATTSTTTTLLPSNSSPNIPSISAQSSSNSGTSTPVLLPDLPDPVAKHRKASAPPSASTSQITVETETVPAVPTVSVAPPPSTQPTTDSNSNANYQGGGGSVNSTVALSGGPQLGSGSNTLRMKKSQSQDVRPRRKKGRSQLSQLGNTKAEIFAAKVAYAVDEVHSSDSDEDFVYESNPMEKPNMHPRTLTPLGPPGTTRLARPSQSSLSSAAVLHDDDDNTAGGIPDLNYDSSCSTTSDHPEITNAGNSLRFQSRNPSLSSVGRPAGLAERRGITQDYSDIEKDGVPLFLHENSENKSQATRTFSGGPLRMPRLSNAHSGTHLNGNDTRKRPQATNGYGSLRNASSLARLGGGSLRRLGSYAKEDSPLEPAKTRSNGSRRGPIGNNPNMGFVDDEDEYYDFDIEADFDEDEYDDASENTPLRRGDNSRRLRKNGQFSPHNFHKNSRNGRWSNVGRAIWVGCILIAVLLIGFVFGFVIATNRPLQNVSVVDITELLISEQELVFDLVVKAFNPGILAVVVPYLDIDVFAKPLVSKDDKEGRDKNILLLGNIDEFDVPLRFDGGFFTRHSQAAIGEVRLNDPGVPRNTTLDSRVPLMLRTPDNDEPLPPDERWKKICSEPFELIVRGVLKYDLPLFHRGQSTTVSKTVKVTPHRN